MNRAFLYFLLAVVAIAAAVLSFAALRDLALVCGFAPELAWLLPVTVDAGAAAGSLVWLGRSVRRDAMVFARALALGLLSLSVLANAVGHGLAAFGLRPTWWVVVIVSAIAPSVLGAVVHLAVLVGRPEATRPTDETSNRATTGEAGEEGAPAPVLWAPDIQAFRRLAEQFEASRRATAGEPGDDQPPLPDRRGLVDTSNIAALCDDLRAIGERAGRQLTQDEVKVMYGIGSAKAGKVRRTLGWWPQPVNQADAVEDQAEVAAR